MSIKDYRILVLAFVLGCIAAWACGKVTAAEAVIVPVKHVIVATECTATAVPVTKVRTYEQKF